MQKFLGSSVAAVELGFDGEFDSATLEQGFEMRRALVRRQVTPSSIGVPIEEDVRAWKDAAAERHREKSCTASSPVSVMCARCQPVEHWHNVFLNAERLGMKYYKLLRLVRQRTKEILIGVDPDTESIHSQEGFVLEAANGRVFELVQPFDCLRGSKGDQCLELLHAVCRSIKGFSGFIHAHWSECCMWQRV